MICVSNYVPREYWLEHGRTYQKQFKSNKRYELQEQTLIDYLQRSIFTDFSKSSIAVLEFGCGFGRITKLLLSNFSTSIREYVAVDMSPHQIENAKKYVNIDDEVKEVQKEKYRALNLKFVVSDLQSFDSEDKKKYFDLVLSCEMLMHIPPSDIQYAVSKLVHMSKKHIINVDWYEKQTPEKAVAPHNFIHQYEPIYRSIPSVRELYHTQIFKKTFFVLSSVDVKQTIFHALIR